jgi:hypothetical protein
MSAYTTTAIEKIAALCGSFSITESDSGYVAAHVVDGLIDNEELNGPGTYPAWTAAYAVEVYADAAFLEREGYEASELDWDGIKSAVAEALRVLQSPQGVVLVNADDALVHVVGADLAAAQAEIERIGGGDPLDWEQLSKREFEDSACDDADGRFIAYRAPLLDWEASEAWRVQRLATGVEYWIDCYRVQEAA